MRPQRIKQPDGKTPTKHDVYVDLLCPHCGRGRFNNSSWGDRTLLLKCHYCQGRILVSWKRSDKTPKEGWFEDYIVSNNARVGPFV